MKKKYRIQYTFDEEEKSFIAVCAEFVGFVLYSDNERSLKKSIIELLRIYAEDKSLTGKDVELVKKECQAENTAEEECGLTF